MSAALSLMRCWWPKALCFGQGTDDGRSVEGVLAAAKRVLRRQGWLGEVTGFAHGMTTATNALLERKGARTASVTTAGFRDILEIGGRTGHGCTTCARSGRNSWCRLRRGWW